MPLIFLKPDNREYNCTPQGRVFIRHSAKSSVDQEDLISDKVSPAARNSNVVTRHKPDAAALISDMVGTVNA